MTTDVRRIQKPLRDRYKTEPAAARYTYHAKSSGPERAPLHATVESISHPGLRVALSVNERIGGSGSEPTPGDLLVASLASCKALAFGMVASALGVTLSELEVEVWGELDHRGVLLMPGAPRAGFERLHCRVRAVAAAGTSAEQLDRLKFAAESCCAMTDTIRNETPLETDYAVAIG